MLLPCIYIGNVYIGDYDNSVIRKVDTSGIITTFAGTGGSSGYSGDGGAASSAKLDHATRATVDSAGRRAITNRLRHVIHMLFPRQRVHR